MTEHLLRSGRRCMLAFAGSGGPHVTPMAFWSDGTSLWMTTSASSLKAKRLGAPGVTAADGAPPEQTPCAVYIPPTTSDGQAEAEPAQAAADGRPARGLVIEGGARVFTVDDPVGLALHWPFVSAAMTALAVKNAPSLAGYARDLPRTPLRWLPNNRVAIRVRIERLRPVEVPLPGRGIAPALPGVVPPDIRRTLAGRRDVVLASGTGAKVTAQPAAVGAGFALDVGTGPPLVIGAPAVIALDAEPSGRPSEVVGLALHGTIGADGRLDAERAVWWEGFDLSGARIPRRPAGGIVLPD